MSKNICVKVTKAFVHGGKIRVPGAELTVAEAEAKPLLEAGKAVLVSAGGSGESEGDGKKKAGASKKAAASGVAGGAGGAG